jgi:hypothetical protein
VRPHLAGSTSEGNLAQTGILTATRRSATGLGLLRDVSRGTSDDVRSTYKELTAKSVEFVQPPKTEHWGTAAIFKDPDGNHFLISSRWIYAGNTVAGWLGRQRNAADQVVLLRNAFGANGERVEHAEPKREF